MQCGDIFHLRADICQLGLDQRKVNMLAREYCDQSGRKLKPVILGHHMLAGLLPGMAKMSKSNPDSAIFMEDTAEDVARKIAAAYCPKVAQASAEVTEEGLTLGSDDTNPCLDYIKSIIFAPAGAAFAAGDQTFGSYAEVEAAFVAGSLPEEQLKAGLVAALNGLLQPVRDHFENDAHAKSVLAQVKSFRQDGAEVPKTTTAVAKPSAPVLVAWLPAAVHHPLTTLLGVVNELNAFVAGGGGDGATAVLLLPDWAAFANNELAGDEKDIAAALDYGAKLCRAYGLDERVAVVKQGELVLADPNQYWLNVIAAGRRSALDAVEAASGATSAGHIISALMRAADVVALKATHLATVNGDTERNALAAAFVGAEVQAVAAGAAPFAATLCDPKAAPTTADDHLYADETELDLRRKAKRAYFAPAEAANTVVGIGHYVIATQGALQIKRKEEQGGDVAYDSPAQLSLDVDEGRLHPGDVKPAVVAALMALTQPARDAMATPEMKKLATVLKNAEKKAAKKAGGK
jgi:tyrosyl-tRNA synthetase